MAFQPTTLLKNGMSPQTATAISSRNKISVNDGTGVKQIGVLGTFDPTHGRGADPVRGVGYGDQIAEMVPGVSDPVTISVTRTLLYLSNIFQVFGYQGGIAGIVRSIKHHKWPFDIKQELVISELSSAKPSLVKDHSVDVVSRNPIANFTSQVASILGDTTTTAAKKIELIDAASKPSTANNYAIITNYEGCWITSYSASFSNETMIVTENADISVTDIIAIDGDYTDAADTGNNTITNGRSVLTQ
jgi:hypothetical protein